MEVPHADSVVAEVIVVQAIVPPIEVNPQPGLEPIWPPLALLIGWPCPVCGIGLVNGTPIVIGEKGLCHASCPG